MRGWDRGCVKEIIGKLRSQVGIKLWELLQGLGGHSPSAVTDSCGTPVHDVLSARGAGRFSDSKLSSVLAQPVSGACTATAEPQAEEPDARRVPKGSYLKTLAGWVSGSEDPIVFPCEDVSPERPDLLIFREESKIQTYVKFPDF